MAISFFQADPFELLLEQMPEKPIAGPSAAKHHAVRPTSFGEAPVQASRDAPRDEVRGRAEQIVQTARQLTNLFEGLRDEVFAKMLARQALGRPFLQVRVLQPVLQEWFDAVSLDGVFATGVERFPTGRHLAHQGIEEHVAGPGLESHDVLQTSTRRQHDDVRESAQVDEDAILGSIGEEQMVRQRDQG